MFVTKVTQTGEEDPVPQSGPEPLTGPNVAQQKLQGAIGFFPESNPTENPQSSSKVHPESRVWTRGGEFGSGSESAGSAQFCLALHREKPNRDRRTRFRVSWLLKEPHPSEPNPSGGTEAR